MQTRINQENGLLLFFLLKINEAFLNYFSFKKILRSLYQLSLDLNNYFSNKFINYFINFEYFLSFLKDFSVNTQTEFHFLIILF
jgi:ADP-heptose:LPS heptosyltransferase